MIDVILYHEVDHDGQASARLILEHLQEAQLVGMDYGRALPEGYPFEGKHVWMVDFTLPPDQMLEIQRVAERFVWIDHHAKAVDKVVRAGLLGPDHIGVAIETNSRGSSGPQDWSACELTWFWLHATPAPLTAGFRPEGMPLWVWFIGRWDIWDHANPNTVQFHYGLQLHDTHPQSYIWEMDDAMMGEIFNDGAVMVNYFNRENRQKPPLTYEATILGYPALCRNYAQQGSKQFAGGIEPHHRLLIAWGWIGDKWEVNLYRAHESDTEIDCAAIAQAYGGGGHPGAAGFHATVLPPKFRPLVGMRVDDD